MTDLRDLKLLDIVHNSSMSTRDHVVIFTARTSDIPCIKHKLEIKAANSFR